MGKSAQAILYIALIGGLIAFGVWFYKRNQSDEDEEYVNSGASGAARKKTGLSPLNVVAAGKAVLLGDDEQVSENVKEDYEEEAPSSPPVLTNKRGKACRTRGCRRRAGRRG